jgi:hypothetical protein
VQTKTKENLGHPPTVTSNRFSFRYNAPDYMSKAQRIILALYCLSVVYCCVWVPWHLHMSATGERWYADSFRRIGYGWLWAGPYVGYPEGLYATPNVVVIGLRLLACAALAACAFLVAGMFRTEPGA